MDGVLPDAKVGVADGLVAAPIDGILPDAKVKAGDSENTEVAAGDAAAKLGGVEGT